MSFQAIEDRSDLPSPAEQVEAEWDAADATGKGWNVDRPAEPEPTPAPSPVTPTDESVAAVLDRISASPEELQDFLNDNPQVLDELEASGAIVRHPQTEAELAAALHAVELTRLRSGVGEFAQQLTQAQLLNEAIELYEEGEYDPDVIADALFQRDPSAAGQFVEFWRREEGYDDEEDAEPLTPDGWYERKSHEHEAIVRAQQIEADAAEQARQAAEAREIVARVERFARRSDGLARHGDVVQQIIDAVTGPVVSADHAEALLGAAVRGAAELEAARGRAAAKADFEAQEMTLANNYMSGRPGHFVFDREARIQELMAEEFNVDRLAAPPSREQREAAIRASLEPDAHLRALGADKYGNLGGWNLRAKPAATVQADPVPESPRARREAAIRASLEPDKHAQAIAHGWQV